MKHIPLDYDQRLNMSALLSGTDGLLGYTAPFYRVLELVRFTDAENKQIQVVPSGNNMVRYLPPNKEFGALSVSIEDTDAKCVFDLISNSPKLKTVDHEWADPLLEALSQK